MMTGSSPSFLPCLEPCLSSKQGGSARPRMCIGSIQLQIKRNGSRGIPRNVRLDVQDWRHVHQIQAAQDEDEPPPFLPGPVVDVLPALDAVEQAHGNSDLF